MIEVKNLKTGVLKGISFITNDKIFVIFGKNGSGKTTLAEAIMGYRNYDGEIWFNGKRIDEMSITERAKMGISLMPQNLPKYDMKVKEYLEITVDDVEEKLQLLGIPHLVDSNVKNLSGGERKKIEFISVMFGPFKTVILDEPDSGVDIYSLPKMIEIMKESDKEIIIITHKRDFAKLGSGIVLDNGEIIYEGDLIGFFGDK